MKKTAIYLSALLLVAVLPSCNKSSSSTPTPPANTAPTINTPNDAWGVMGVVKLQTSYTTPSYPGVPSYTIDYNIVSALAAFSDAVGSANLVDAGTVKVNDTILTKLQNNGYSFSPSGVASGSDLGLNPNSFSHFWNVSGSGSVTGFTYQHSGYLPPVGTITSSADVQTNAAYTLSVNTISNNCDSIIWIMAGPNGNVRHTTRPGVYSSTFTASEVASLGKGDNLGLVQVTPYYVMPVTINAKKYYFIKESCATKSVNLK
ncbi:MAG: hypothetical protein JNL95_07495 [Chitinophagales bacterium]|nr:hypothetical protein [Chitinophagales bacterium]